MNWKVQRLHAYCVRLHSWTAPLKPSVGLWCSACNTICYSAGIPFSVAMIVCRLLALSVANKTAETTTRPYGPKSRMTLCLTFNFTALVPIRRFFLPLAFRRSGTFQYVTKQPSAGAQWQKTVKFFSNFFKWQWKWKCVADDDKFFLWINFSGF